MRHRKVAVHTEGGEDEEPLHTHVPDARTWLAAFLLTLVAGISSSFLMAHLTQQMPPDAYLLPAAKRRTLEHLPKGPYEGATPNTGVQSIVSKEALLDVCLSRGAGVVLLRDRRELLTDPFTVSNKLRDAPYGPFITEASTTEVKQLSHLEGVCVFMATGKSDSPSLALFEVVLPVMKKRKAVCMSGEKVIIFLPAHNKWLAHFDSSLLASVFGISDVVVTASKYLNFQPPFVHLPAVHLLDPWDLQGPTRDEVVKHLPPVAVQVKKLVILSESKGPSVLLQVAELGRLALSLGYYPVEVAEPCVAQKDVLLASLRNAAVVVGARGGGLAAAAYWVHPNATITEVYTDDARVQQPYSTDRGYDWFRKVVEQRKLAVHESKGVRKAATSFSTYPIQYSEQHLSFILSSMLRQL